MIRLFSTFLMLLSFSYAIGQECEDVVSEIGSGEICDVIDDVVDASDELLPGAELGSTPGGSNNPAAEGADGTAQDTNRTEDGQDSDSDQDAANRDDEEGDGSDDAEDQDDGAAAAAAAGAAAAAAGANEAGVQSLSRPEDIQSSFISRKLALRTMTVPATTGPTEAFERSGIAIDSAVGTLNSKSTYSAVVNFTLQEVIPRNLN